MVSIENNSHLLYYVQSYVFKVYNDFLALTLLKSFKLPLFGMKFGTPHYLVYIFELKWFELITIEMC